MSETSLQHSPLEASHQALGAKMVPFAGWNMPVQYSSIMDEHLAVREAAGVFDISHMGQVFVRGAGAEQWLNGMLSNDVEALAVGQAQYTFLLNEAGGVIDDLILYRVAEGDVFLVVNASKLEEDMEWLQRHLKPGLTLSDESESWAGMAVQGPESSALYYKVLGERRLPERNGIESWGESSGKVMVCRTGYTGEDGFELFCPASEGEALFQRFIDAGAKPCGLGARDTLRLELCYPLNGNDLNQERSPLQAGLGFFCALETDFIGVEVLRQQKALGLDKRLVALQYVGKGPPPRAQYSVHTQEGEQLGVLSSGAMSPTLKQGIAMAYLPAKYGAPGTLVDVDVRGRRYPAEVVKKPFYRPQS
ncbi:glycine cleavage system aminomethyltransferase GcvT [Rubritalea marina]|uniref:glycine cleavage system aminomethyltransferase GcvT n=1 Tax=Rubritalea marina TaxID=361055 RepID=UPI0003669010|nr:glycine cleavage system aminomethyltransferase GcvT [Rubritalea marina]